ncbi:MAG: hypothetical protein JXR63_01305 [Spirochaetales bacterium]|nr:hypothetical protein [Spirochaetales bacterium]
MDAKLTLKLDQSLIQKAKLYAKQHNSSVSKLVEDYFENFTVAQDLPAYSPLVQELSGVISPEQADESDYHSYPVQSPVEFLAFLKSS